MRKAIVCASLACASVSAFADNNILPTRSRDRLTTGSHSLSTIWTKKTFIGAGYDVIKYDIKQNGNNLANGDTKIGSIIGGYGGEIFSIEYVLGSGRIKSQTSSTRSTNDSTIVLANMGFKLTETFGLSLGVNSICSEEQNGDETAVSDVDLGASINLENGTYIGFGIGSKRTEKVPMTNPSYDVSTTTFFAGIGHENFENDSGYQIEGFIKLNSENRGDESGGKFLIQPSRSIVEINYLYALDNLEFTASVSNESGEVTESGYEKETTNSTIALELEYKINENFYIKPALALNSEEVEVTKSTSSESEEEEFYSIYGIGAGFRTSNIEFNAKYGFLTGTYKEKSTPKYDADGHTFSINLGYIF